MSDLNDAAGAPPPVSLEPHGEAALILVESLIHGLLARGVLSAADAQDILDLAVTTQASVDDERLPGTLTPSMASVRLAAIASSLRIDLPETPGIALP